MATLVEVAKRLGVAQSAHMLICDASLCEAGIESGLREPTPSRQWKLADINETVYSSIDQCGDEGTRGPVLLVAGGEQDGAHRFEVRPLNVSSSPKAPWRESHPGVAG
jgi:hypothetical protein